MIFEETVLTGAAQPGTMAEVLSSPAGYYIGFRDADGAPYSRESRYFESEDEAKKVLANFRGYESLVKRERDPDVICLGDTITYRPCFGQHAPTKAKVVGMSVTDQPRAKYGQDVESVQKLWVRQNRVCFDLDDGHWCYSDQLVL